MSEYENIITVGVKNNFSLKIAMSLKYNFKRSNFSV